MTSIFQHPLAFEAELEPWHWQGLTRRVAQIPVAYRQREMANGTRQDTWYVPQAVLEGRDVHDQDQPGGACWTQSEAFTMASGVNRVLTGIASNRPFGDVEGFYLDAQNHGLDWSSAVFRIPLGKDHAARPHSLLSWAVQHGNLRAVKSLLSRGASVTDPVNALDRALCRDVDIPSTLKIVQALLASATAEDINRPAAWCRQRSSLTAVAARFPMTILAASQNLWDVLGKMLDLGAAPNVCCDTINGPGLSLMQTIERTLSPDDRDGWALHRKALALSETELLHAEVRATAGAPEARVRPRL